MRLKLGLPAIVVVTVIAVGSAQLVEGALDTGIAIDEPTQLERTYGWIAHGWYVPGPFLRDGQPDPGNPLSSPFVYGPAYSSIAHLANVELGNEPIGNVSFTADAYRVRHLVVAALALLAVAVAGLVVWFLTGSWRFGLWTAAALLAVPAWLGQGFFNPKDVPAGTGYTLVTAALVFALAAGRPNRRRLVAIAALLAFGMFIGIGTRLALWAPMGASMLAYAGLRMGQRRRGATEGAWRRDLAVLGGIAIGLASLVALYPQAFETPRTLLTHSISGSANYQNESVTLTAGRLLGEHPPWWYLPTWFGAQMPLLIGMLTIVGAAAAFARLAGTRERGPGSAWARRDLGLVFVLLQAALLPILTAADGATIYDAARQHLYVFPALAILAGIGAERVWGWSRRQGRARAAPMIVAVGLAAALAIPMAEQTALFPYNYVYVNPVAGIGGVNGTWETDYWYVSGREALTRVPRHVRLRCSSSLMHPSDPASKPGFGKCGHQPFEGERGTEASAQAGGRKVWVISFPRGDNRPPPWCEDADDVTRWLRGEEVVMAYVLRCDPDRVRAGERG